MTQGKPAEAIVFGYNAEAYNSVTDLQYLRYRHYDVSNGRFQNQDDYLGDEQEPLSRNRYNYVHGNPVMGTDPTGHCFHHIWIFWDCGSCKAKKAAEEALNNLPPDPPGDNKEEIEAVMNSYNDTLASLNELLQKINDKKEKAKIKDYVKSVEIRVKEYKKWCEDLDKIKAQKDKAEAEAAETARRKEIRRPTINPEKRTCLFGCRCTAAHKNVGHNGTDFSPVNSGYAGDKLYAAIYGKVKIKSTIATSAGSWGMGLCIQITSEDGRTVATYMHLSEFIAQDGATVYAGDPVAKMGNTGNVVGSIGPQPGTHLHFEVKVDGKYVDPLKFLSLK